LQASSPEIKTEHAASCAPQSNNTTRLEVTLQAHHIFSPQPSPFIDSSITFSHLFIVATHRILCVWLTPGNMSIYCYRRERDEISDVTAYEFPCGNLNSTNPIVQCCGYGDICLTNGMCSYEDSMRGGSGYYVAGCTDSSGLCPGFANRCTSSSHSDATWNVTSGLWQCCGVDAYDVPSCNSPSDEQFNAPSPALLQTVFSVPPSGYSATSTSLASTASTTTASVVDSSTPTSAPSSNSGPSSPQSGLSIGAKAGIGVGAALGALAVIGLLIYLVYRQRGRRRRSKEVYQPADIPRQR
jgi:hypothetical protein